GALAIELNWLMSYPRMNCLGNPSSISGRNNFWPTLLTSRLDSGLRGLPSPGNWKKKFSAQEIQELMKGERNVPLIIDFYATWCGPCILMAQEIEMV
ncbi:thioredoxin-like protein CITRX chloroplastic-like, partial [Trifolium pratense]